MRTPPFKNRFGPDVDGAGVAKWVLERIRRRLPKPPASPIRGVQPDLAYLKSNSTETTLSWVGHSTLLLQHDGVNILTDPMFSDRASPFRYAGPKRHQPPGIALHELPHIDLVLLSHSHFDHLDLRSVQALQKQAGGPPHFMVPLGTDAWFTAHVPGATHLGPNPNVQALGWDDATTWPGQTAPIELHFLATQHWSNRSALRRNDTLWGSWALLHPAFRFWFSGDLGYSEDTRLIGERFGRFDLAAIAIGAYEPRWFMKPQHINPDEAVQVMLEVGAREAIGIHWGTFALTDEPLDQPPRDLQTALQQRGVPAERFTVLKHGETRRYQGASGADATTGSRNAR